MGLALLVGLACSKGGDPRVLSHRPDAEPPTWSTCVPTRWHADGDRDGWGDFHDTVSACSRPEGYVRSVGDCDPADGDVYPGAVEHCDGVDHDCDGLVMDDDPDALERTGWFLDGDGDGYGAGATLGPLCVPPAGSVGNSGDCDDTRADVHPFAVEVCDGVTDEDCDRYVDEAGASGGSAWWPDADGDGYGDAAFTPDWRCSQPEGWVANDVDCDDADAASPVEWFLDVDADDHGDPDTLFLGCSPYGNSAVGDDCDDRDAAVYPGAPEADCASGVDANCDGALPTDDQDADGALSCEDCDDLDPAVAVTCDAL